MSDSTNKEEERLLAKIRKLFALGADKSATGSEAETAMRMANALLDKHKIDKFKLHEQEVVFASFCDYPNVGWIRKVCNIIGPFYNCKVLIDNNWDVPKTLVIGTSANRMTAVIVIDQLIRQIKHESKGKGARFINGAVFGLADKCKEIQMQRAAEHKDKEAVPGTGLTVIDIDKQALMNADDFMHTNFPNLVKTRGRKVSYSQEGRDYGKGLGVDPQGSIGGGQKRLS